MRTISTYTGVHAVRGCGGVQPAHTVQDERGNPSPELENLGARVIIKQRIYVSLTISVVTRVPFNILFKCNKSRVLLNKK